MTIDQDVSTSKYGREAWELSRLKAENARRDLGTTWVKTEDGRMDREEVLGRELQATSTPCRREGRRDTCSKGREGGGGGGSRAIIHRCS